MSKIKNFLFRFFGSSAIKALIAWMVIIVVAVVLVDKLFLPMFAGHFAKTGEVPNLEGVPADSAEAILAKAGFKVDWEEGRYSTKIPADMVLGQKPVGGRVTKLGRTILLTKSLGLRQVEVPNLRGKSQKQALISLTRAGLVQGEIVKGAHQSIPRGVVIRTVPMAGDTVRAGDTIQVVISAGVTTGNILLPSYVGENVDQVMEKIEKAGFVVGTVKRIAAENEEASGTVLETSPKEGDYLPPETKINLVVAE